MIEVKSLTKRFSRERLALDDVSFSVKEAEVVGLLGHNGAGKSTVVGVMLGMVRPDAGEVIINGSSVQRRRNEAMRNVGAIFEAPAFYDYISGWHNLRSLCALSGWWNEAEVWEVLKLVNLEKRIHSKVRTYSHGMRQRLALAQALLPMPKVLLLDEPTDGLDPEGIHEFRSTVLALRKERGLTIMLNSHLLGEVEQMCDRCVVLREGKKVYDGSIEPDDSDLGRYLLETPDVELARQTLAGLRIELEPKGRLTIPLGMEGAQIASRLVQAGVRLNAWTPQRRTLEDWYLQLSHRPGMSKSPNA